VKFVEIESVKWGDYHLSPEELIEAWVVAADMLAVIKATIRVKEASDEDLEKLISVSNP
jgi:hypothetical protein